MEIVEKKEELRDEKNGIVTMRRDDIEDACVTRDDRQLLRLGPRAIGESLELIKSAPPGRAQRTAIIRKL